MESKKYDIAIVGSGIGALSCASFISKLYNKKVVVIEQNSKIGGFSKCFYNKDKIPFEIGIHLVGELEESSMFTKLMKFITDGNSFWRKLPDVFQKFHFPDGRVYGICSNQNKQKEKLFKLFPKEKENIAKYYEDIEKITRWYRTFTFKSIENDHQILKNLINTEVAKLALLTTEEYLNQRFYNKKIRELIGANWTDFGLPPGLSAFLKHALTMYNYKEGAYYPEYGSDFLLDSIKNGIEKNGGEFILNTLVKEINHQGDKATSLTIVNKATLDEAQIVADYFISGIGIINTYSKLFDYELAKDKMKSIEHFKNNGVSFISLFATLKSNPEKVKADASLSWVYGSYDHNQNFSDKNKIAEGTISQCSISFPSLKKTTNAKHSMKINSLVDYSLFRKWEKADSNNPEFIGLKKQIGEALLATAEKLYPGINNIIDSWDLQTPLAARKNTLHYNGNIFGISDTPERFKNFDLNCHTPLKNVFLTGTDITSAGIYSAVLSSVLTISAIFEDKQFFMKVLTKVNELSMSEVGV